MSKGKASPCVCHPDRKNIAYGLCRSCYDKKHYPRLKPNIQDYQKRKAYGISQKLYEDMVEARGGRCDICGKPCSTGRSLAVDHNHLTCRVRGLLCSTCNRALGMFYDDPNLLRSAIRYLGEDPDA